MFYLLIILLQMKLIRQINDLNEAIKNVHQLGFIPTMGGLHKGHESLIKASKKKCQRTLVSIFVNPRQFNDTNDYKNYPRQHNKDLKVLKKLRVDFVFLPSSKQIYKNKDMDKFILKKTQKILCAKYRKKHFEGVLDVMNRLINLIKPKYVFMGKKDFQQLFLVKKYLEKKFDSRIIACKTIRNKNKVALSSRNIHLSKSEMNIASFITKELIKLKFRINRNKKNSKILINNTKKKLLEKFDLKIQYLETRNILNLKKNIFNEKYKLFIAYYIGGVRLIDNF
jgi:pantoate--beta-alanine ligase